MTEGYLGNKSDCLMQVGRQHDSSIIPVMVISGELIPDEPSLLMGGEEWCQSSL